MVNDTDIPGMVANEVDVVLLPDSFLAKLIFAALQPPVITVAGSVDGRPAWPLLGCLVAPIATVVTARTITITTPARRDLSSHHPLPPLPAHERQATRFH